MGTHQLAQINIAVKKAPLDSPVMADFMANLVAINALAERTPGFVWRLQTEEGNATALRPIEDDDDTLINMSVWADVESLRLYVYQTTHVDFMRRRHEWFERMTAPYQALWWVPAGHLPTVEEGLARLELLSERGPSPEAFTFRQRFPPPGEEA